MMAFIANHLWQSTLVAGFAGLFTLAFRRHRAQVRHGIWLAASLKFLVPFALLVGAGSQMGWRPSQVDRSNAHRTGGGSGQRAVCGAPGTWESRDPRARGLRDGGVRHGVSADRRLACGRVGRAARVVRALEARGRAGQGRRSGGEWTGVRVARAPRIAGARRAAVAAGCFTVAVRARRLRHRAPRPVVAGRHRGASDGRAGRRDSRARGRPRAPPRQPRRRAAHARAGRLLVPSARVVDRIASPGRARAGVRRGRRRHGQRSAHLRREHSSNMSVVRRGAARLRRRRDGFEPEAARRTDHDGERQGGVDGVDPIAARARGAGRCRRADRRGRVDAAPAGADARAFPARGAAADRRPAGRGRQAGRGVAPGQ